MITALVGSFFFRLPNRYDRPGAILNDPRPRLFSVSGPTRCDTLMPVFETLSVRPPPSDFRFWYRRDTAPKTVARPAKRPHLPNRSSCRAGRLGLELVAP